MGDPTVSTFPGSGSTTTMEKGLSGVAGSQVGKPVMVLPGSLWPLAPCEAIDRFLLLLLSSATIGREPVPWALVLLLPLLLSACCGMETTPQLPHRYHAQWGCRLSLCTGEQHLVVPSLSFPASCCPYMFQYAYLQLSQCGGSLRCPSVLSRGNFVGL